MRNIELQLEKAVEEGRLDPQALAVFAAHPERGEALLQKSRGGAPTRGEVQMKLEQALCDGKLQPGILGLFVTDPDKALSRVSSELKKSYGLPDRLGGAVNASEDRPKTFARDGRARLEKAQAVARGGRITQALFGACEKSHFTRGEDGRHRFKGGIGGALAHLQQCRGLSVPSAKAEIKFLLEQGFRF